MAVTNGLFGVCRAGRAWHSLAQSPSEPLTQKKTWGGETAAAAVGTSAKSTGKTQPSHTHRLTHTHTHTAPCCFLSRQPWGSCSSLSSVSALCQHKPSAGAHAPTHTHTHTDAFPRPTNKKPSPPPLLQQEGCNWGCMLSSFCCCCRWRWVVGVFA